MELLAEQQAAENAPIFELVSTKHSLQATAREIGRQFVVLKGSKARPVWIGEDHSYRNLRQALIESGVLRPDSAGNFEFAHNAPMGSPSAASAVVLGRPDNGRLSWQLKGTAQTYADWQKGLPADTPVSGDQES